MVARKSSLSMNPSDEEKDSSEEEIVDYAATADAFFVAHNSDEEVTDSDDSATKASEGSDKGEEDDESSLDEFIGESDRENDDDNDESVEDYLNGEESCASGDAELRRQKLANAGNSVVISGTDEPCSFDLRNLLALSSYPIDSNQLYTPLTAARAIVAGPSRNEVIPRKQAAFKVNEEFLLQKTTIACTQLILALWKLPIERSDVGPLVTLPLHDESKVPRSLPPPPPKVETKWEKFAKAKGIGQNKEKRSAKVWDETTGEWLYRHGYQKAGNDKEWPIMEVKQGDDPFQDPWEKQRDAKQKRVDKNMEQHMRNEERAGHLSKGTSTRTLKSISARRKLGRDGGRLDVPVGVPVDLKSSGKKGSLDIDLEKSFVDGTRLQRGKESTVAALRAVQVSTASLGKFDKMREGEPERNNALSKAVSKKRKYESATSRTVVATETERSLKVLKSLSDGGVAKEKERMKGRLATGETAYDYDYDDGLGAATFRKKKGRAGVGKMKKMTKKRVK